MRNFILPVVVLLVAAIGLSCAVSVATAEDPTEVVTKVRAYGTSRDQAIRIAYRRAEECGPFEVVNERVYPEGPRFCCILTIVVLF